MHHTGLYSCERRQQQHVIVNQYRGTMGKRLWVRGDDGGAGFWLVDLGGLKGSGNPLGMFWPGSGSRTFCLAVGAVLARFASR